MSTFSLPLVKGVEETSKVLAEVPEEGGKVISIGRKLMRKIKGSVSSLIYKSKTHEFAQEAEASNTKPITKQGESRGWFNLFKVWLMLLLVLTTVPRGVRSEDVGNPIITGSTEMNSLLANKNLRGHKLSERRETVGTEGAAMNDNINYKAFQRRNSPPNNPKGKQANPYERACNSGDYCRQGHKGKKN